MYTCFGSKKSPLYEEKDTVASYATFEIFELRRHHGTFFGEEEKKEDREMN